MKYCGDKNGDSFRNSMSSVQYFYIFQTIVNLHSENSRRKKFTKILDIFRCHFIFFKNKERKIARCHCSKYAHSDCNYLLCQSHAAHLVGSSFSLSLSHCSSHFRSTVSRSTISIIVGIIKESAPKRIRHTSETRIPIIEETWIFSFIH